MSQGDGKVAQKREVITVLRASGEIADRIYQELIELNRRQLRTQKTVHLAECVFWLETLKEANDIISIGKKDRKN